MKRSRLTSNLIGIAPPVMTASPVLHPLAPPTLRRTSHAGKVELVTTPQHRESMGEGSQDLPQQIISRHGPLIGIRLTQQNLQLGRQIPAVNQLPNHPFPIGVQFFLQMIMRSAH